ncbi:MAG: DUF6789 family protein [Polyangiaceae bacterium]
MRNLIRSVASGLIGGLGATGAMSLAMLGAKQIGLLGEPPPRKLVRHFLGRMRKAPVRGRKRDALAVAAHFAFGGVGGAIFGAVEPRIPPRVPRPLAGMLFGTAVWALSYAGWIPRLGVMAAPHKDRPGRPLVMIASHWIYGAVLGGTTNVLRRTLHLAAPR